MKTGRIDFSMNQSALHKLVVIGGNGFVGSAVCRAALARGMQVTSISRSGAPYRTPKGHSPAWTSKVDWQAGDALQPDSYANLFSGASAVVHTLGTLLEDARYKAALREGNVRELLGFLASGNGSVNPLEAGNVQKSGKYELINRDAALRVCETFISSSSRTSVEGPRPFVYVSAEDIWRPFISARYIETKREAEREIGSLLTGQPSFRAVYIRPSLIYHPHFRPAASPLAALLDLSATMHSKVPAGIPTPSGVLHALAARISPDDAAVDSLVRPSALDAVADLLSLPPIHVDHVAEAICIAAEQARTDVRGIVGVERMRELIGWTQKGQLPSHLLAHQ